MRWGYLRNLTVVSRLGGGDYREAFDHCSVISFVPLTELQPVYCLSLCHSVLSSSSGDFQTEAPVENWAQLAWYGADDGSESGEVLTLESGKVPSIAVWKRI